MAYQCRTKYSLVIRAMAAVLTVTLLKLGAHWMGWEILSLNPLFSGIVAANVFLMGFLLSGVINDFKESERLPGEMAAILETFSDEAAALYERSGNAIALEFSGYIEELAKLIHAWFYKKEKTSHLMDRVSGFNRFLLACEPLTQANFIVRLKQEQHSLRRTIIRIHAIRETSFISSGYLIAELTTISLAIGLILAKIDPFYESLFFTGVIVFLLTFLILLIRDLDNPFGHYQGNSAEDVSLKPLEDFVAKMAARAKRPMPEESDGRAP